MVRYTYPLSGAIRGAVNVTLDGMHVDISSTSSKIESDQNYRVQATLDAASRPPVLRCQVTPLGYGPATEIMFGGAAPIATGRIALHNDAGAPWGQLTYDRDTMQVIDPAGKTRVELVHIQRGAPEIKEGFTLPAAGPALFHVRVLDADGTPAKHGTLLRP